MSTLISGGTIVTASDTYKADLLIDDGVITTIGKNLGGADTTIDASGKYVIPGGIDVHTHLDMPFGGTKSSDDFFSGHKAAAFGGTTCHIDFAVQPQGATLLQTLDAWKGRAAGKAAIDYAFHIAITNLTDAVMDEIPHCVEYGVTSLKLFMAYKGSLQVDDSTLFRTLQIAGEHNILICVHAENGDAIDILIKQAVAEGHTEPVYHVLTRPPELEAEATERAIRLAEVANAPLYVVHLTNEGALHAVKEARGRGKPIYAETCTQYFFFTKDDLARPGFEGAKYVCSPPFRTEHDQEVLWQAVADGSLQVVSTDHCPFWYEGGVHGRPGGKELGRESFAQIPNGCPGIEDRMKLLYTYGVRAGRISLNRWVELCCTNPAKLFGMYPQKGTIAVGTDADLVVWDGEARQTLSAAGIHGQIDYNLYEGMDVTGVPSVVLSRGQILVENGDWKGTQGAGQFVHRKPFAR